MKDDIFKTPYKGKFKFNQEVTNVFDDMAHRSIPQYEQMQSLVGDLCKVHSPIADLYDIGCATGTTLLALHDVLPLTVGFHAIDSSASMLNETKRTLSGLDINRQIKYWPQTAINMRFPNAGIVLAILTMQFMSTSDRTETITNICDDLLQDGIFILVEKVTDLEGDFTHIYHKYKEAQGYSRDEIRNKDAALDGVLRTWMLKDWIDTLERQGFTHVRTFFQWCNFVGIICIKR